MRFFLIFAPRCWKPTSAHTPRESRWHFSLFFHLSRRSPSGEKARRERGLSVELSRETASAKFMAGGSVGKTSQNYTRTHTHLRGQPTHKRCICGVRAHKHCSIFTADKQTIFHMQDYWMRPLARVRRCRFLPVRLPACIIRRWMPARMPLLFAAGE
jgi:hypothetical protein